MKMNTDLMYPIGTYYTTESSTNPSNKLGGTWELVRETHGGELLAFGIAKNTTTEYTYYDRTIAMSELKLSSDILEDYSGQNVLKFEAGTWSIYPQGIVGMVKSNAIVTGLYNTNIAIWWGGNNNTLPTGVYMSPSTRCPLLGGAVADNYNGCSLQHFYKVTTGVTSQFFINPVFKPYNGVFQPGTGGVGIVLEVEVFANTGKHYIWKRVADNNIEEPTPNPQQ